MRPNGLILYFKSDVAEPFSRVSSWKGTKKMLGRKQRRAILSVHGVFELE